MAPHSFPTDTQALDSTPKPALTLVTGYPFSYIGSAPDRFVVRAFLTAPESSRCMSNPRNICFDIYLLVPYNSLGSRLEPGRGTRVSRRRSESRDSGLGSRRRNITGWDGFVKAGARTRNGLTADPLTEASSPSPVVRGVRDFPTGATDRGRRTTDKFDGAGNAGIAMMRMNDRSTKIRVNWIAGLASACNDSRQPWVKRLNLKALNEIQLLSHVFCTT